VQTEGGGDEEEDSEEHQQKGHTHPEKRGVIEREGRRKEGKKEVENGDWLVSGV